VPNRSPQLRTRPPTDDAALLTDPPVHARRRRSESAAAAAAEGTLIHHVLARAIRPLMVAMIEPTFRTVLMATAGGTHAGEAPRDPARGRTVGMPAITGRANPKRPETRPARPHAKR